jgi:hypothetical protein
MGYIGARVCAIEQPSEVLASQTVMDLVRDPISPSTTAEPTRSKASPSNGASTPSKPELRNERTASLPSTLARAAAPDACPTLVRVELEPHRTTGPALLWIAPESAICAPAMHGRSLRDLVRVRGRLPPAEDPTLMRSRCQLSSKGRARVVLANSPTHKHEGRHRGRAIDVNCTAQKGQAMTVTVMPGPGCSRLALSSAARLRMV